MKRLCIYHAKCADGFTAAWAVYRRHPDTEFFEGVHGAAPPDCTGREVILVDFCYKRDVLLQIAKVARSVLILDHHKTAENEVVDLPDNVITVLDMSRSGAMIAWQYFHPGRDASALVVHVQDRDLWRFNHADTRAFSANLFSYEYTFDNWDMVDRICANGEDYRAFIAEGAAIERKHHKDVAELIAVAARRAEIGGFDVPILNAPYFYSSDAGHALCQGEPFAACYWDTPTERKFSLRSSENGEDVSLIAARFGGGGHKHAAGFSRGLDQAWPSTWDEDRKDVDQ